MTLSIKDNPDYPLSDTDFKKLDKEITKAVKEINKMIKSESKKPEKDHIVGYVKNDNWLKYERPGDPPKTFNDTALFKEAPKNQPINIEQVKERYKNLQKFNAEINGKLKQRKNAGKPIFKSQVENQKIINNLTSSIKKQLHIMILKDELTKEKDPNTKKEIKNLIKHVEKRKPAQNNKISKEDKEQAQSIGKSLRQKLAGIIPSTKKETVNKDRGRGG